MSIRIVLAAAALLMSACAQPVSPTVDQPMTAAPPAEVEVKVDWQAADTAEKCSTINGQWRRICMMGKQACVVTFKDAGDACSDSSECSGRCITSGENVKPETPTKGVCTTTSDPCGCFQIVEKGKAGYSLCVD